MSLAQVRITREEFEELHSHLISHYAEHRNMHMRDAAYRTRGGERERVLIHLHAMYAHPGRTRIIEGKISGPDGYWHYQISLNDGRPQLDVFDEDAGPKARARIRAHFKKEIAAKLHQENRKQRFNPKRLPGHYYLKRSIIGMSADHPNCRAAVEEGVLDEAFVASLQAWNLALLHP